jgi:hypothetical protein
VCGRSYALAQIHRVLAALSSGEAFFRRGLPQSLVDDSDLHRKGFTTPVLLGRVYRFLRFPLRGAASAFIPPPSIGSTLLIDFPSKQRARPWLSGAATVDMWDCCDNDS